MQSLELYEWGYIPSFIAGIIIICLYLSHIYSTYKYKLSYFIIFIVYIICVLVSFKFMNVEVFNYYSRYKAIIILVLIYTLFNGTIKFISYKYTYKYRPRKGIYFNRLSSWNTLIEYSVFNFIKLLSLSYVICILLLPTMGLVYWSSSSRGEIIISIFQSIIIVAYAIILSLIIYYISDCYVILHDDLFGVHYYKRDFLMWVRFRLHIIKIDSICVFFIIMISILVLFSIGFMNFPQHALSKDLSNNIYRIQLRSQYPGEFKYKNIYVAFPDKVSKSSLLKYSKINKLKYKIYSGKIHNTHLILHLGYKDSSNIGVINRTLTFNLYRFNMYKDYFRCEEQIPGYKPVNIRLILNEKKMI